MRSDIDTSVIRLEKFFQRYLLFLVYLYIIILASKNHNSGEHYHNK